MAILAALQNDALGDVGAGVVQNIICRFLHSGPSARQISYAEPSIIL